jgi:hypothetical protein
VADYCEQGYEISDTIKFAVRELFDQINDYQLLKGDSAQMELVNIYSFYCSENFFNNNKNYRTIGLILDSIHRLVYRRQKSTKFRKLYLSPSLG